LGNPAKPKRKDQVAAFLFALIFIWLCYSSLIGVLVQLRWLFGWDAWFLS
jgi:hypothetical protein